MNFGAKKLPSWAWCTVTCGITILIQPEEKVFTAPWEARIFAIVMALNAKGLFTWSSFADALSKAVQHKLERPYYESWLAAAHDVLVRCNALEHDAIEKVMAPCNHYPQQAPQR